MWMMQLSKLHLYLETFSEKNKMNLKQVGIGIVSLLLVIGGIWAFMINAYVEDLGTTNVFTANDSESNLTKERNNSLFGLSFSEANEDLEWSKLRISIEN